jgi:hypothetical protein
MKVLTWLGRELTLLTVSRGVVAGFMLIMAGGRLGLWSSLRLADALPNDVYAYALLAVGLALFGTIRTRYRWYGRLIAALGAILLGGMAWDVGKIGNTVLMESWFAFVLTVGAFSDHDG